MDVKAADTDQLLRAAQQNNPNQIRDLVTLLGIPPSSGNGINQTALHVAAIWGHVESIQILIELVELLVIKTRIFFALSGNFAEIL